MRLSQRIMSVIAAGVMTASMSSISAIGADAATVWDEANDGSLSSTQYSLKIDAHVDFKKEIIGGTVWYGGYLSGYDRSWVYEKKCYVQPMALKCDGNGKTISKTAGTKLYLTAGNYNQSSYYYSTDSVNRGCTKMNIYGETGYIKSKKSKK